MATITKRNSRWQAQVRREGRSLSKSFSKKSEALAWATQVEAEFIRRVGKPACHSKTPFSSLLEKYQTDVLPSIRGIRPEQSRLGLLKDQFGNKTLHELTLSQLANYRNQRLKEVGPQTVKHELGLLLRILRLAQSEWGYALPNGIPQIKMPKLPQGRTRRLEEGEEERLVSELPKLQAQMLLFTLETALRRGELCAMRWEHYDPKARLLRILETKTGRPRIIPLSTRAKTILEGLIVKTEGYVWGLEPDSVSRSFQRACSRLEIKDLHWHDLRHEAVTRLIERGLSIPEASLISGHTTSSMLARYTHIRPESLVEKLA